MPSQFQLSHELGLASLQKGDFKEARKHFRNMVKESRKHSEKEQASALNRLGSVCIRDEKFDEAEEAFTKSVDLHKKVFGEEHPETAMELSNLGFVIWHGRKDRAKAKPLFESAVQILEAKMPFSEEYSDSDLETFATAFENLGNLKEEESDHAGAEPLFKKALEINLQASDNELSQPVLRVMYFMTGCFEAQGRETDMEQMLAQYVPKLKEIAAKHGSKELDETIAEYERTLKEKKLTEA
ncbi:MAG TPA: tetratricopeptide repeat protein [Planktothrix sp.]